MRALLVCASFSILMLAWRIAGVQSGATATAPPPPQKIPSASAGASPQEGAPTPCSDPLAIVKAFYDANEASQFDKSLAFLTEDATLSTWAEGVNGYHARERHFTGKKEIRPILGEPGLRRTPDRPDGPIYRETRVKVSSDRVSFILEPDRLRPNGKPYNPFRVEAIFAGCKIKSLTVIDLVTWL